MIRFGTYARGLGAALGVAALAGCQPSETTAAGQAGLRADRYLGVETRLLGDDLVNLVVWVAGNARREDVVAYADCAAAQYALARNYGFARHVRTSIGRVNGKWRGDAVYTISKTLPKGVAKIDAEVAVEDCAERGIPTV